MRPPPWTGAPHEPANPRLAWTPVTALFTQLAWTRIGGYWLEASDSAALTKYPGHDLLNLRTRWSATPSRVRVHA